MKCVVTDCGKDQDRKQMCSTHYMRHWRNGTTDRIRRRKGTLTHSHGYIIKSRPSHPLADNRGYVYEHRLVCFDAYGKGPFSCHWCGDTVNWAGLHVDHIDDDKKNNDIENLALSCPSCNTGRGRMKAIRTWRRKTGVEYEGSVYSVQELADIRGISRPSLISRLKKMSVNEAMSIPKGNTGPK